MSLHKTTLGISFAIINLFQWQRAWYQLLKIPVIVLVFPLLLRVQDSFTELLLREDNYVCKWSHSPSHPNGRMWWRTIIDKVQEATCMRQWFSAKYGINSQRQSSVFWEIQMESSEEWRNLKAMRKNMPLRKFWGTSLRTRLYIFSAVVAM